MFANLCLLAAAFSAAQSGLENDIRISPRLERGHELMYRGTYHEEATGSGVQFRRDYRLDTLIFVLGVEDGTTDLAVFTQVRGRLGESGDHGAVRLELARMDARNRLTARSAGALLNSLDGPPTLETGAFVETPGGPLHIGQTWKVAEERRPDKSWRILGYEDLHGTSCLKLEATQQAEEWESPRADRASWRARDTVWISPLWGIALRIERHVDWREPARLDSTRHSVVAHELMGPVQYPGPIFENRKREIIVAEQFAREAAPLLPNPTRQSPRVFDSLLARINRHLDMFPATPYREAIVVTRRRVEAARRGESPPIRAEDEGPDASPVAALGRAAPGFMINNLFTKKAVRLHDHLGQTVLLVFYQPTSSSAQEVLRYADRMGRRHAGNLFVLGLPLVDDVRQIRPQYEELFLTFPIAAGNDLRHRYAVEATPHLVVIDSQGFVRAVCSGWGPETPQDIGRAINQCTSLVNPAKVAPVAEPATGPAQRPGL